MNNKNCKNNDFEKDIYYKVLKWSSTKGLFNKKDVHENFPNESKMIYREIEHSKIFCSLSPGSDIYYLSLEDRFKLFQFESLKEAREDSKNAKNLSIFAIGISIILGLIQIIL